MRKLLLIGMLLFPCTVFAGSNCRIIEYPDHNEAVCDGDNLQPAASVSVAAQEETQASAQTPEPEKLPDVPAESIVRNNLARAYGDSWLKSQHNR